MRAHPVRPGMEVPRAHVRGFFRHGFLVGAAALAAVVLTFSAQQATAADTCSLAGVKTWKAGAASNSWFQASNWAPSGVPTSGTHVCIQNAPPGGFVRIGTGTTAIAASIESRQPITVSSGGLRLNSSTQGSSMHSTLSLTGGATLGGAGNLTVDGTFNWTGDGSTVGTADAGSTVVDGTLAINGPGNRFLDGPHTLRVNGTANWSGTADLDVFDTTLEVGPGGKLDAKSNRTIVNSGGTPLLRVLSGGTLTKSAGTGPTTIGIPVDNDGTTNVGAGTLSLGGGSSSPNPHSGQWSAVSGSVLDFSSGTHTLASGANLSGAGTVRLSGGELDFAGATSTGAATTFNLTGGTLGGAGDLTVDGTFNWTGDGSSLGDGTNTGSTTIASGGTLAISGTGNRFLDGPHTLRVNGTANWSGTVDLFNFSSTIEVGSGGKLDAKSDQSIIHQGGAPLLHVLSGGTLTKSAGTGTTTIGIPVDNNGTIDVGAGTLGLSGAFANYDSGSGILTGGAYRVRNGATFQFTGADVRTNAADITLDGAGSRFFDGSADGLRNFQTNAAAGTFHLLNGSNFSRTGSVTNNGTISLAKSTTFATSSNFTQGSSGRLETEVAGLAAGTSYGQLVAGTTTLAGSLIVDSSANTPVPGDFYDLVMGTPTGTFSSATIDEEYRLTYLPGRVRLGAVAPETTITSGPPDGGATNDNTPTFGFNSDEPHATFQCSIDSGAFAACTSPETLSLLPDGQHSFAVRAVDRFGNQDQTPASRSFAVDTVAPNTTITNGPVTGSTITDSTPTFEFSSNEPNSTFRCSVDGGQFAGCTSPETLNSLPDGQHSFAVQAMDLAGHTDPTPASRSFTVDTTPPNTTITGGPSGATNDPTPTFSFSSEAGVSFECKVDSGGYSACISPKTLAHLEDGSHAFSVQATDQAGNVEATPDSRSFTISTADVSISGSTLVVTAAAGAADNLGITRPSPSVLRVTDAPGGAFTGSGVHIGTGCTRIGDYTADCSAGGITLIQVTAGDQNDKAVNSTALNSQLGGGAGADSLEGGNGNDRIEGTDGNDDMRGGAGIDTLSYEQAPGGVRVDIAVLVRQDTVSAGADLLLDLFENVAGSGGSDELYGNGLGNRIVANNLNDLVSGRAGDDDLFGSAGNDTLNGQEGNDDLNGGPGSDTCNQGPGSGSLSFCNP
jgi:hemolysin type calcium-binding protein